MHTQRYVPQTFSMNCGGGVRNGVDASAGLNGGMIPLKEALRLWELYRLPFNVVLFPSRG
jgi:hypothetical protein